MRTCSRVTLCFALAAVLAGLLAVAGCVSGGGGRAPGAASGGRASGGPVVLMGMVPVGSVSELFDQTQPLADYVGDRAGAVVRLVAMRTYDQMVEDLAQGELSLGISGSYVGYRAMRDAGAIPLARPERGGSSTYEGLILVRKDSGIRTFDELKGKSLAMVRATSAGELFPKYLVAKRDSNAEAFFSGVDFLPKHEDTFFAVLEGDVDGAAVKDKVYEHLTEGDTRAAGQVRIVAKSSGRFPDMAIIASKSMDAALRQRVRAALLGSGDDPAAKQALERYGAERFVPTAAADYEELRRMATAAGL